MKNFKKNHDSIRQNGENVKNSQKHDVNLQKNSTLYFQIGLIMCLLATYAVIEMKFLDKPIVITGESDPNDEPDFFVMNSYEIYKERIPEKVVKPKPKVNQVVDVIEVDKTNDGKDLPDVFTPDITPNLPVGDPDLPVIDEPEVDETFNIISIEKVPVFPGCEKEKTNSDKIQCFEQQLSRFIQRKFRADLASGLGLQGKQKIDVEFLIGKSGEITVLNTRAPHPVLEEEAKRVVDKLPKMTPGKQGINNVAVKYQLPIVFKVVD